MRYCSNCNNGRIFTLKANLWLRVWSVLGQYVAVYHNNLLTLSLAKSNNNSGGILIEDFIPISNLECQKIIFQFFALLHSCNW